MVTLADTQEVTATTTLSAGTVVTISVRSTQEQNEATTNSHFALTNSNCYENITVSGGNMVGHRHKEIVVRRLTGGTAQYAANGTAPSAGQPCTNTRHISILTDFPWMYGSAFLVAQACLNQSFP